MSPPQTPERTESHEAAQRVVHSDPHKRQQRQQVVTARRGRPGRASMPASRTIQRQSSSPLPEFEEAALPAMPSTPSRETPRGSKSTANGPAPSALAVQGQASRSRLGSRQSHAGTPAHTPHRSLNDKEIATRSRYFASLADEIIGLYEGLGRAFRDGDYPEIVDSIVAQWDLLVRSKDQQLLSRIWQGGVPEYLDSQTIDRQFSGTEKHETRLALKEMVTKLNRAQFLHSVYQLPIDADTPEAHRLQFLEEMAESGSPSSLRDPRELLTAMQAFFQYIVPVDPTYGLSDDPIMLYFDIARQFVLASILLEVPDADFNVDRDILLGFVQNTEQDKIRRCIQARFKAAQHSNQGESLDIEPFLEMYANIREHCIAEMRLLSSDIIRLKEEFPFALMADEVSQYVAHLDVEQDSQNPTFYSSKLQKLYSEEEAKIRAEEQERGAASNEVAQEQRELLTTSKEKAYAVSASKRASIGAAAARDELEARTNVATESRESVEWAPQHQPDRSEDDRRRPFPRGPVEHARDHHFDAADDDNRPEKAEQGSEQAKGKRSRKGKGIASANGEAQTSEHQSNPKRSQKNARDVPLRRSKRNAPEETHDGEGDEGEENDGKEMASGSRNASEGVPEASEDELYLSQEETSGRRKKQRRLRPKETPMAPPSEADGESNADDGTYQQKDEEDEIEDSSQESRSNSSRRTPARSSAPARGPVAAARARRRQLAGAGRAMPPPKYEVDKKKRYVTGHNVEGRQRWTDEEVNCLCSCLDGITQEIQDGQCSRPYARVLELHGPEGTESRILAGRNNVQLKDKARNVVARHQRLRLELPDWAGLLFRSV